MVSKPVTKQTARLSPMSLASDGVATSREAHERMMAKIATRAGDYLALTKPRVMSLVVFTAVVGLVAAPGNLEPAIGIATILCIAIGAGAAGALNMWYDADVDALMGRTAARPIPRGRLSPRAALAFGLATGAASVTALGLLTNVAAAGLLAFTIFFYVAIYTIWLKRSTPQSIVIGGAAGASPPVIAWIAATGTVDVEPLVLFLIVFFWTPPHFWALALNRAADYSRARIPALPVAAGEAATRRQILVYTILLLPISLLPFLLGFATAFYATVAVASGATMIVLALKLRRRGVVRRQVASRLFAFSICHLVFLFAALLIEKIMID
jgi:protoheme IX farnesyltransferase